LPQQRSLPMHARAANRGRMRHQRPHLRLCAQHEALRQQLLLPLDRRGERAMQARIPSLSRCTGFSAGMPDCHECIYNLGQWVLVEEAKRGS
jgi:hypothetical protein